MTTEPDRQEPEYRAAEAEWMAKGMCVDSGMSLIRQADGSLQCRVCDCFGRPFTMRGSSA